jgi:hypothetical protein
MISRTTSFQPETPRRQRLAIKIKIKIKKDLLSGEGEDCGFRAKSGAQ